MTEPTEPTPEPTLGPLPVTTQPPTRARWTRADALDRADKAWRARVAGATWAQAAEIAGYTDKSNCLNAVQRVYGTLPSPQRDDLRNLWRERCEWLWREALQDVQDRRPGAVVAAVRVAQAAAALDALNEPTLVNVDVNAERLLATLERELIHHGL